MKLVIVLMVALASFIYLPSLEAVENLGCIKEKTCTTLKVVLKGEKVGGYDTSCGNKCDARGCFKDGVYYAESGCKDVVKWVCDEGEQTLPTGLALEDKDCDPNGIFDSKNDALKIVGMILIGWFVGRVW